MRSSRILFAEMLEHWDLFQTPDVSVLRANMNFYCKKYCVSDGTLAFYSFFLA